MKRFTIIAILLNIYFMVHSQAVLEHIYPDQTAYPIKLTNYGWIYYTIVYRTNHSNITDVKIYNENHSLLKTIPLQIPSGYIVETIDNVSDILFNSDSKIEILYSVWKINSNPYQYQTLLVNEDGTILQTFPTLYYATIADLDGNFKMIGSSPSDSSTYIYALPGIMLQLPPSEGSDNHTKIFPDPADSFVNIKSSSNATDILIYTITGSLILSNKLDNSGLTRINTTNLIPGIYIYKIFFYSQILDTGQFAIIK